MLGLRKSTSTADGRRALAAEMRDVLRRHVQEAWFPRCIDGEGGYHSNFSRSWKLGKGDSRMLEFQARQARAAARFAIADPADGRWAEYALHGMRYLRDRMWDREHGGWFLRTKPDGRPLDGATKHSHGAAYAAQACALVFRATGERWVLEHGEEALAWYARQAHDGEHGGFHNWMTREGEVIFRKDQVPAGEEAIDPLGHDIGLKDVNVEGDWFEALLDLATQSSEGLARQMLAELGEIYLSKMTTPAGEVHYAFHPDWTPQPGPERYGYGFQGAHRLLTAARSLPELAGLEERAGAMARHTLKRARHPGGGYVYAGPAGAPESLEGTDLRALGRSWWVQFEALRVLSLYAANEGTPGPYWRLLRAQWKFVREHLLDSHHGGVFSQAAADLAPWRQPWIPRDTWATRKGDDWKDASHETDSLLTAIAALERQGPASNPGPAV